MHPALAPLAFIDGLGGPEMLLVFVLVLLLFGGQKLPEFARGLGKTMREFKKAAAGVEDEFKRALEEDERKKNLPALAAAEPTPALPEPAAVIPSTDTAAATPTPATPAPTPAPDPYHDHSEHDSYHDQDHYAEAGPEAPGATPPDTPVDKPKSDVSRAPVPPVPTPSPAAPSAAESAKPAVGP